MGILQIANHMVCSTFSSSFFFHFQRNFSTSNMYRNIWKYFLYRKRNKFVWLYLSLTIRLWTTGGESGGGDQLPNSFHGLQEALQSPRTHCKRHALNSAVIYFFPQWTPITGHLHWNGRKSFPFLIEEHQRRKGDTRKMTTMKRKLKWFYWTGCIPSRLAYEVITISHITVHD